MACQAKDKIYDSGLALWCEEVIQTSPCTSDIMNTTMPTFVLSSLQLSSLARRCQSLYDMLASEVSNCSQR